MKTIIAIKGHAIRHKEVIEILEMLGGENKEGHGGWNPNVVYYICDNNIIRCGCAPDIYHNIYKCVNYTLEEFLEKYPYKVGDKVRTIYGKIGIISKLIWSNRDECIRYELEADTDSFYFVNELQPYKEETMEIKRIAIVGHKTRGKEVIEILEMLGGINTYKYSGENEEICFAIGGATKMIYYDWISDCYGDESGLVFTLEEFLEKYPYKVGDKVIVKGLSEYPKIINFMKWVDGDIHYSFDNETWFLPSALNLYKEETMEVKRIAIAGHKTRSKEVIEILEMLGGRNTCPVFGFSEDLYYYIKDNYIIHGSHSICNKDDFKIFTVEEFREKYPYKVGDRVRIPEYESEVCINKMLWNGNEVLYEVVVDDEVERYSAEELNEFNEPNKEETITIDDFKANTKEWLIDKLHDMVISKAIKTIGDIHEELHKPQYPKTYIECAKILDCFSAAYIDGYKNELLEKLQELLICRDAYWKIAGEQMGLGKPWEPDWLDTNTQKYCIYYVGDEIKKQPMLEVHHFLAFPTKEMSDIFLENFKELIESCKDFL